jgi:hypothetical protein
MDKAKTWARVWAVLLAAVPPLLLGWALADCEICAWMALGCAAGSVGVGVWITFTERF